MTLQQIYERLELTNKGCLIHLSDADWETKISLPSRVVRLLKKNELLKTMDGFFCFDNKPLMLFFDNPDKEQKAALHQAIWNFNESPVVISLENDAVEIFNGFAINENTKLLKDLGGEDILDDFSYFKLVTGKTWEEYNDRINHNTRVDYRLLENIEESQKQLKGEGLIQKTANALLGKIIFFRYLIDRHIRLNYQEKVIWTNKDLCNCLKDVNTFKAFVKYIEKKFNGDMFRIADEEFATINQRALNILIRLLQSEDLSTGQMSLFDLYDFSILPIEFISNIYEKFIGKEKQEKKGAYYTPTFLVDYIVSETVGKKLNESNDYNCRVLDPACGSGIFLVESLRRMIEKYISQNKITNTSTEKFKETLRGLAIHNIFGIDEDFSAIQVAIFSVYLTLLDYQEPADLSDFKFPNLLGTNLICSDTFDIDNKELKAFEEKKYAFDFIVGNPPWKRGGIKSKSACEKYLIQKGYFDKIGNKELAQAFVFRSLDFANTQTQCAFVLVSKVLYNIKSRDFRLYLLENIFINRVFELAAVRKEVFNNSNDPAIAPSCVIFYRNANGKSTNGNVIEHIALKPSRFFTLFKVFCLMRNDIQKIQQDRLKKFDWLWKVLVYGSFLDFIFIKRIKSMPTIESVIKDNHFIRKQGIKEKDKDKSIDVSSLKGWHYIETKKVKKYHIEKSDKTWNLTKVGYIFRDKDKNVVTDLYRAPILLVTGGTTSDLHAVSAISYSDGLFKSSLTGIKGFDDSAISILRNISGMLNSSFFAYYNLLTFSSSGIEREETHDEEKFGVPYCTGLDKTVKIIDNLTEQYYDATMNDTQKRQQLDMHIKSVDNQIYKMFLCSDIERDIIDYALQVSIPLAVKSYGYQKVFDTIPQGDKILNDYASVYINHFASSFSRDGKKFVVEIVYSTSVVGMYFKVIDETEFTNEIIIRKEDIMLSIIPLLSSEKITEELFVQKDIRGFEKDFFYIFKPNEKRLWHKAIAHLDVYEFDDAMLKVGGNNGGKK